MKKYTFASILVALLLTSMPTTYAQTNKKVLTLDEVIELARTQSTNALIARNRFRASYWQYRSYKANYLPSLSFSGTVPSYSTEYQQVYNSQTGAFEYVSSNLLSMSGNLSLSQNIGLTGGSIAVRSGLAYSHNMGDNDIEQFIAQPIVSIQLTQPILKYNSLKWEKKTQPLQYDIAKQTYLSNMEDVNATAVRYFFSLALAQINVQIAETNYTNSDTLYRMSEGRYQLGTIAEDELLQMKLSWLNSETNLKQAQMNLRDQENRLKTFLGFNDNVSIELEIPYEIPTLQIDEQEVLAMALENNPDVAQQELSILQSQSSVAQARANRGLSADLTASYGLSGSSSSRNDPFGIRQVYEDPKNSRSVMIGVQIPILDWGRRKGQYENAKSNLELVQAQAEQTLVQFEQDLLLNVEQFNLQYDQVMIAAQSDTVAQRMYEVSKARYVIGSSTVLELQNADTSKDSNRRAYIQAIQTYWNYFYQVRKLALYDFINRKPLEVDYDSIVR